MTTEQAQRAAEAQRQLADMLERYEAELDRQAEADATKKAIDERVDNLKAYIVEAIMDIEDTYGIDVAATSEHYKYTVGRKSYYRVPTENKEAAIRSLRALKLGELVQTKVDPRTLTKALREIEDANRDADGVVHLPTRYNNLMSRLETYDQNTLYKRKK